MRFFMKKNYTHFIEFRGMILKTIYSMLTICILNLPLFFFGCNYNPLGGGSSHVDEGNTPFLSTPTPFAVNGVLVTDGQVNLAWDVAKNADDYTVVYGTSSGDYPNTAAGCSHIQAQVCVVTGLVDGTPYYFNVVARNRFGTIDMKNEVLATPNPFSLLLTPKSRSALVSWGTVDAGIGNTYYTVQSGSSPSTINNSEFNVTDPHLVQGLPDGFFSYFQVIASNSAGTIISLVSSALIIDPPSAPTWSGSGSVVVAANQITLNWIASTGGGTIRYSVYRTAVSTMSYASVVGCYKIPSISCTDSTQSLQDNNKYFYMVVASNEGGNSPNSAEVVATTYPIPNGLIVAATTATTNTINWNNSLGNADISYNVYRDTSTPVGIVTGNLIGAAVASTYANPVNNTTDNGPGGTFAENTLYYYALSATNANNTSNATVSSTALPSTLSTAPASLAASSVTDNSLSLGWSFNKGNAPVTFHVYRSLVSSPASWGTPLATLPVSSPYLSSSLTYPDSNLAENIQYYYMVDVINNRAGALPQLSSTYNVVTALKTAPVLSVAASDTTGITFQWTAKPAFSNGTVTYQLYRSTSPITGTPSGGTPLLGAGGVTSPLSFKDPIAATNSNTQYWYYITATNNSPSAVPIPSNVLSSTTALQTAPTLTILSANIQWNALKLNWSITPTPTGSEPLVYNLYRSTTGTAGSWGSPIYTGSNTTYTDNNNAAGLSENTKYYYYVSVTNNAFQAQPLDSTTVSETTALQSAAQFTQAQTVATGTHITLVWNALPNNSTVTYQLLRSPSGAGTWSSNLISPASSNTTFTDTAPAENTAYDYKLISLNQSSGTTGTTGLVSNTYTVTSDITSTPTMNAPTLNTPNPDNSINLSWSFPTNPSTISYDVYRSLDQVSGSYSWNRLSSFPNSSTSVVDRSNVLENTYYNYQVTVTNAAFAYGGSSKTSTPVQRILTNLTTAPTLTASLPFGSNTQVNLQWSPVATGNGSVTYKVYRSTTQPVATTGTPQCTTSTTTITAATSTACIDSTSVSTSQTYYYAVTVSNAQNTLTSNEVKVVTKPNAIASAPLITATDGTIHLVWGQSASAADPTLLNYEVWSSRSPASNFQKVSTAAIPDATGASFDDMATNYGYDGLPIYYQIIATTDGGASAASGTSAVTPIAAFTLPPASVNVTSSTAANINFSWTAPNGAANYKVYSATTANGSPPPGGTLVASGCTGTSCSNLPATVGTNYYYTVVASNTGTNSTAKRTSPELAVPVMSNSLTSLVAAPGQITLTWPTVAGAQSYSVAYIPLTPVTCNMLSNPCPTTSQTGCTVAGGGTSPATCSITNLFDGQSYGFTLSYVDSLGNTIVDPSANATPIGNFVISTLAFTGASSANVGWSASLGADTYSVQYRIPPASTFTQGPNNIPASTNPLAATVTSLTSGFNYSYQIVASNTWGSVITPEMTLQLPPATPSGLQVTQTQVSPLSLQLQWTLLPSNPNVTYKVYRSDSNSSPYVASPSTAVCTALSTASTNNSCTDSTASLVENKNYYYVISALNTAGESAVSSPAVATTSALATRPAFGAATSITDQQLTLNWTLAQNATNNGDVTYNIYRYNSGTSTWPVTPLNATAIANNNQYIDSSLSQNTIYQYQISVTNSAPGQTALYSDANFNNPTSPFSVTTKLHDPVSFTTTTTTASSVTLNWSAAAGNGPVTYKLYRQLAAGGGTNWTGPLNTSTPTARTFTDNDSSLVANTTYKYKITVLDSVSGSSELFDPTNSIVTVTTALASNPIIATIAAQDASSIKLTWSAPPGNAVVTYTVSRANSACSASPLTWNSPASVPNNQYNFTDTGLTANTTYCYKLTALNLAPGAVAMDSAPLPATTDVAAGPSGIVTTASANPLKNTLSWTAYAGTGVTTFTVKRYNSTTLVWDTLSSSATSPYNDTNIQENTSYEYSIAASNNSGLPAHTTNVTAFYSALQTPLQFNTSQTSATDTQINLPWTTAAGTGPVTYKLYRYSGGVLGSPIYTSPSTAAYSDGTPALAQNTVYTYQVSATNTAPSASELFAAATYPVVTDLSSNLQSTVNFAVGTPVTSTQIPLTWSTFTTGATFGVVTYNVYQSSDATGNTGTWGTSLFSTTGATPQNTYTVTGLQENTKYVFKLTGKNNSPTPTTRDSSNVTVTTALATAPTLTQVTGQTNPLTFSWTAAAGNQAVTYKLYRSTNANNTVTTADTLICTVNSPNTRQCADAVSPEPSIQYNYAVITSNAQNAVTSNVITLITAPNPVTVGPTLVANGGAVTVTWASSPSAATPSLLSYKVEKAVGSLTAGFNPVSECTAVSDTTRTCSDTVIADGTTIYYYRVTAMTAGGNAAASPNAPITPISAVTPVNVAVTAGTSIQLTWSGAVGVSSYKVYRSSFQTSVPGDSNSTQICTSQPCSDTGILSTPYYYYIVASNANAPASTASTTSAQVVVTPVAAATLTAVGSTGQITLSWSPVLNAESYTIFYSQTSGQALSSGTSVSCLIQNSNVGTQSCFVSNLTDGTPYYFALQTVLPGNVISNSAEVQATPFAVPTISSITATSNAMTVNWGSVAGATGYELRYGTSSGSYGSPTTLTTAQAGSPPSYTISGLIPGTVYYVQVKALNPTTTTTSQESVTVTIPVAPSGISIASAGYNNVTIQWNNNRSSNLDVVYRVYRSTDPAFDPSASGFNTGVMACWYGTTGTTPNSVNCTDDPTQTQASNPPFQVLPAVAENTKYYYKIVTATNPVTTASGTVPTKLSTPSANVSATTDLNSSADSYVFSTPTITATSVTLTWKLNLGTGAGTETLNYQVLSRLSAAPSGTAPSFSAATCQTTLSPTAPGTNVSCTISSLASNTKYDFKIRATNNTLSPTNVDSSVQTATTTFPASGNTFAVTIPSVTDTTATLNWTFNVGNSNALVNFSITQNGTTLSGTSISSCATNLSNVSPGNTTLSCTVSGLSPNTTYAYAMVATSVGNSSSTLNSTSTAPSSAVTKFTTASNSVAITQTATLNVSNSITLNWTMPVGNSSVDYTINTTTAAGVSVSANVSACTLTSQTPTSGSTVASCVVGGLSQNTDYLFNIVATNHATGGNTTTTNANAFAATTPFNASSSFTIGTSAVADTSVTLSWPFSVGSSTTSFSVAVNGTTIPLSQTTGIKLSNCSIANATIPTTSALSCQVNGLVQNTSYQFKVTAQNNKTTSRLASSTLTVITGFTTATPPISNFTLTAGTPTATSVVLNWNFNIGSSPVVNFTVLDTPPPGSTANNLTTQATSPTATPSSCTLTNVTPGTAVAVSCVISNLSANSAHSFTIVATNNSSPTGSIKNFITSNAVVVYTNFTPSYSFTPTLAANFPTYASPGQAQITWTFNNGTENVNYTLQNTDASGTTTTWSSGQVSSCTPTTTLSAAQAPSSTAVTCKLTGLVQNTTYQFSVVATSVNNSSYTKTSGILTVLTPPVTAPTIGVASILNTSSIQVSWTAYAFGSNPNFTYRVYASDSGTPTTSSFLFCSASSPSTSCIGSQYTWSSLVQNKTYSFIVVVQNTSQASTKVSAPSTVAQVVFSKPINNTVPGFISGSSGVETISSSGIARSNTGTLTASLGAWSDSSNCTFNWYKNNNLFRTTPVTPPTTTDTYTLQAGDQCKVFSYCVTCSNALGPTGATDLSTTQCSLASSDPSTHGISTTLLVDTDYANRVATVAGSSLTAAGRTQIKNFLTRCITATPSIPLPDVMYAMRSSQNAGRGATNNNTKLFDLYCDQQNATLASSSFTWDNNGVMGAGSSGIAVSNNPLFNRANPSTQIAYAQTPTAQGGTGYEGVMGYESVINANGRPYGGFGYNRGGTSFLEDISGTSVTKSSGAGSYDFLARSLSGIGIVVNANGTQSAPTNNRDTMGEGKFILGDFPPQGRGTTLKGYLPFAAAWTGTALTFDMMENVRTAVLTDLRSRSPTAAYLVIGPGTIACDQGDTDSSSAPGVWYYPFNGCRAWGEPPDAITVRYAEGPWVETAVVNGLHGGRKWCMRDGNIDYGINGVGLQWYIRFTPALVGTTATSFRACTRVP